MNTKFTPERSDAIGDALVAHVAATTPPRRRGLWAVALVAAGAIAGAGVSAGAFAVTRNVPLVAPSSPAAPSSIDIGAGVPAPPGVVPGDTITSLLGDVTSSNVTAVTDISLADRPMEATHAQITVIPARAGSLRITDGLSAGNQNTMEFDTAEMASGITHYRWDLPLTSEVTTLHLEPSTQLAAIVTVQFVTYVPTQLGVNPQGQTYGSSASGLTPDLTWITNAALGVKGYVYTEQLLAISPDHPGTPVDAAEESRWREEAALKYPDGWDIPVFENDGTTRINVLHLSN